MVFREDFAQLVEVRPGRSLFVRKVSIGGTTGTTGSGSTSTSTAWQLVCLHGTCASERQYQCLLEAMDEHLSASSSSSSSKNMSISCLLFDSVGCGQSPPPQTNNNTNDNYIASAFSNEEIQADLRAVLKQHANPTLPTVLVGHSYASAIFLPLLEQEAIQTTQNATTATSGTTAVMDSIPQLVTLSGCVFLSTAVRGGSGAQQLPLPDGGHILLRALPVPILRCLQSAMTEAFIKMAVYDSKQKNNNNEDEDEDEDSHKNTELLKTAIRADSNRNDIRIAQAYHRNHLWASASSHLNSVRRMTGPTLIVHGADDGVIPVTCAQYLHHQLPQSKFVVIEKASHMVMLEQAPQVAKEIILYLSGLPKS